MMLEFDIGIAGMAVDTAVGVAAGGVADTAVVSEGIAVEVVAGPAVVAAGLVAGLEVLPV